MEAAFAILLLLVAGHLWVRGCDSLRYKMAREDGHRLYFRIAYHGVLLFLGALVLSVAAFEALSTLDVFSATTRYIVKILAPMMKEPEDAGGQLAFLFVCFLSVLLGRVLPPIVNFHFSRSSEDALWEAAQEDEMEEFLLTALAQAKTVAATLTSGKVYVGWVLTTPEPRTSRRVISLLPLMSGYRKSDGGKVIFTTYYDQFYPDLASSESDDDFKLILPIDKMTSLAYFDIAVYAKFNASKSDTPAFRKVRKPAQTLG